MMKKTIILSALSLIYYQDASLQAKDNPILPAYAGQTRTGSQLTNDQFIEQTALGDSNLTFIESSVDTSLVGTGSIVLDSEGAGDIHAVKFGQLDHLQQTNIAVTAHSGNAYGITADSIGSISTNLWVSSYSGDVRGIQSVGDITGTLSGSYNVFETSGLYDHTADVSVYAITAGGHITGDIAAEIDYKTLNAQTGAVIQLDGLFSGTLTGDVTMAVNQGVHSLIDFTTSQNVSFKSTGSVTINSTDATVVGVNAAGNVDLVEARFDINNLSGTTYGVKAQGSIGTIKVDLHFTDQGTMSSSTLYGAWAAGDIGSYQGSIHLSPFVGADAIYGLYAGGNIGSIETDIALNGSGIVTGVTAGGSIAEVNADIIAKVTSSRGTATGIDFGSAATEHRVTFADGVTVAGYQSDFSGNLTGFHTAIKSSNGSLSLQTAHASDHVTLTGRIEAQELSFETGNYSINTDSITSNQINLGLVTDGAVQGTSKVHLSNSLGETINLVTASLDFMVDSKTNHSTLSIAESDRADLSSLTSIDVFLGDTYFDFEQDTAYIALITGATSGIDEAWLDANMSFTLSDGTIMTREELAAQEEIYVYYRPDQGLFLTPDINTIPEPSTAAFSILALAAMLRRRRRARH